MFVPGRPRVCSTLSSVWSRASNDPQPLRRGTPPPRCSGSAPADSCSIRCSTAVASTLRRNRMMRDELGRKPGSRSRRSVVPRSKRRRTDERGATGMPPGQSRFTSRSHAASPRCRPSAATRRNALSPGRRPAAFTVRYGLNPRTLQDWEQGRAQTDGPARAYLLVILRGARAVERALAAEA